MRQYVNNISILMQKNENKRGIKPFLITILKLRKLKKDRKTESLKYKPGIKPEQYHLQRKRTKNSLMIKDEKQKLHFLAFSSLELGNQHLDI